MRLFIDCIDPKIIIVSENQIRQINEAMDGDFRLDDLESLPSYRARLKYCREHLGKQIGSGSSRVVFQVSDNMCLKLAKNEKGIAQNDEEGQSYHARYCFMPKVFSRSNSGKWLLSEYVLPSKAKDFIHCLGMEFDELCDFVEWASGAYNRSSWYFQHKCPNEEYYQSLIDYGADDGSYSEFFDDLYSYIVNEQPPIGDLKRTSSWGMAMRDGKPMMVLLDSGFSQWVLDKYYKR